MATNEEMRKWPRFDDVRVPETGDKRVAILTGSDHPEIMDLQLDKWDPLWVDRLWAYWRNWK